MLILAQILTEKWFKNHGFAHSQTTNKLVNEVANDSAQVTLAGKIVKYRPLSEPIRLQDLDDSARSQAWKKTNTYMSPWFYSWPYSTGANLDLDKICLDYYK